ncbi:MAG: MotA/TolQ/ExbB proton channel family protein [Candidatus Firestonebacteria bacterium]
MEMNFVEILRTSFTLIILILCSIVAITFMIERWWYYRKCKIDANRFMEKVQNLVEQSAYNEAISLCDKTTCPLTLVIKVGIVNHKRDKEDISELMESKKMEERLKMERWLGILGTLGNTAPFIGLFGTVIGIINAFGALAASGSGGPAIVAKGIAEALIATAGGLVVAIPCVMVFNYFMRKVKRMTTEIDVAMKRLLVYMNK